MIRTRNDSNNNFEASINCNSSFVQYIGETQRNLKKYIYIYKHRKHILHNNLANALVIHRNNYNHAFDLKNGVRREKKN